MFLGSEKLLLSSCLGCFQDKHILIKPREVLELPPFYIMCMYSYMVSWSGNFVPPLTEVKILQKNLILLK
jgi:hypothetical protein